MPLDRNDVNSLWDRRGSTACKKDLLQPFAINCAFDLDPTPGIFRAAISLLKKSTSVAVLSNTAHLRSVAPEP